MRVRRRKRRAPRRHRRVWLWLPVVGGLLLVVGALAGLFLRDVQMVRGALVASEASLADVRASLGTADLDDAAAELERADQRLGQARSRSNGPLWNLAVVVPGASRPVEVVRSMVDVASAATAVGQAVVRDAEGLATGGLDVRVTAGEAELAPLQDAQEVVAGLPIRGLEDAFVRLQAADPTWSPAELADARLDALAMAEDTIATVHNAQALVDVLPSYLGAEETRRYFVGIQTSGELRATGGLIGFYSVLTVARGAFELGTVEVYEGEDDTEVAGDGVQTATAAIGQLAGGDVVEADAAFTTRYEHTGATGIFSNVNVDPDVPTTARVALDLYRMRTGDQLDGMILLDPIGMQALLEATGSTLSLPDDVVAGTQLATTVDADAFARFTTVDVYEQLGSGHGPQRKELLRALGTEAFTEVFAGDWDGMAIGRALARSAGGRHLQVFSEREDEQASFVQLGAAGAFATPVRGDHLAVTVNNAVGGKQDVHLGHRFDVQLDLRGPRRGEQPGEAVAARTTRVRTELANPLTADGFDPYIVGNCLVGDATNRCFDGPAGHNRSWWSVWTPGTDRLRSSHGADGGIGLVAGSMHERRVFDRYVETAPESAEWFELELDGPVTMTLDGSDLIYEFTWWRQAKAIPDLLDLTVTAPDGWEIRDAALHGGTSGMALMGPDADAEPVELSHTDDEVRLHGAVSRDATVQIRLGRT